MLCEGRKNWELLFKESEEFGRDGVPVAWGEGSEGVGKQRRGTISGWWEVGLCCLPDV